MIDRHNGDERRQACWKQSIPKKQNACKCALGGSANPMRRRASSRPSGVGRRAAWPEEVARART
jgi:hypothetical protein